MKRNIFYKTIATNLFTKVLGIIMILFISSCVNPEDNYKKISVDTNTHTIDVSDVKVDLPKMQGVELVEANCVPCHSLRYIEMQPEMTKKSWEKIVTKMIKNFGAPVKDSLMAYQIVDYLFAIKGKK